MPSFQCERSAILLCGIGLALATALSAHAGMRQGEESSLSGARVGDQSLPQIAIGPAGGYVVWQDNAIDGAGKSLGIGARRFTKELTPFTNIFRVNKTLGGLQENPQVALMKNGGAAFVWQGGKMGNQDIYFRTALPTGGLKPLTDVRVNGFTKGQQSTPVITCLSNGNLAVAWCSLHQDKYLEGIYARIVTPSGTFPSPTWVRVNQFTGGNQRSPAITTLSNGNFVVVWTSDNQGVSSLEMFRHTNRVHVYARVFSQTGAALGDEFRVNTRSNVCARPAVTRAGASGFAIVWAERGDNRTESWDICARTFSTTNTPATDSIRVNRVTYGDQFVPRIASIGSDQLVVWNSLGHDGSREGVFGRFLSDGQPVGDDFRVNTHTRNSQVHPAAAGNGKETFLVGWTSFLGASSFDVQGQLYSAVGGPSNASDTGSGGTIVEGGTPQTPGGGPLPPLPPGSGVGSGNNVGGIFRVSLANTVKGKRLSWETEPGRIYQVQYSTNFSRWDNLEAPRAAAAASDSTLVGNGENAAFYRVIRLQ